MTQEHLNIELDFVICGELGMTQEDLDEVRRPLVKELRRTVLSEILTEIE